jgi:DNA-binding protein HU-beta
MAKARRTTHRSRKGTKLYAVRDRQGRFKDIQTYKRAHSADLRTTSQAEGARKKKAGKKAGKKKTARRKTAKRRARRR